VTSKHFLLWCAGGFIAALAVILPLNIRADIYGLFRPAKGRILGIYGEERIAKYLQSFRYVPENFNGVLLGSSTSSILDTREFLGYRVYNASIQGGNIEDLKPIAENIFRNGELKLTVLCLHRYLTNDHARKTDFITPKQYWGALGSPQLMNAYVSKIAIDLGLVPNKYDEYGTIHLASDLDMETVKRNIADAVEGIERGTASTGNYYVDPVALAGLQDMLTMARRHSRRMLIFYPPLPAPILAIRSAEYARYRAITAMLLTPEDIVVDFNDQGYEKLRADPTNFVDAVHLSRAGARRVISELAAAASQSIGSAESVRARTMTAGAAELTR